MERRVRQEYGDDGGRYVLDGAEWHLVDPNGVQRHRLAAATNLHATAALTEAGLPTGLDAETLLRSPPDDAADWRSEAARREATAHRSGVPGHARASGRGSCDSCQLTNGASCSCADVNGELGVTVPLVPVTDILNVA